MNVGFTGTRNGMTDEQRAQVRHLLRSATVGHHGDCVGADAEFHEICMELGVPVIIHPPTDPKLRAFCEKGADYRPARPYLDRNRDIVHECEILVATPKEAEEPLSFRGSGTWYTIKYARSIGRITAVLLSQGGRT